MFGNEKNKNNRDIDSKIESTLVSVKKKYVVMSRIEMKSWKAYLIITFVAGFSAALIWSSYNKWYIKSGAEGVSQQVSIYSLVDTNTHASGDQFQDQIFIDTAGQNIVAVQAIATYDPNKIEVLSADISQSVFPYEVSKSVDSQTGRIIIALAKPTPGVNSSQALIANLTLRALSNISEAPITLKLDSSTAINDSAAVLDDGSGTNVLGRVYASSIRNESNDGNDNDGDSGDIGETVNLSVTSYALAGNIVKILWQDSSTGVQKYLIKRKTRKTAYATVGEASSDAKSYVDKPVLPKTTYFYQVCKVVSGGSEQCHSEQSVKTLKKRSIAHPRLSARSSEGKVILSWSPEYTADFNILVQKKNPGSKKFVTIQTVKSDSQSSAEDASVTAGQKVSYRLYIQLGKQKLISKTLKFVAK